jgi:quercetin dioxygenase-like cupin family protein
METAPGTDGTFEKGDDGRFTGEVWLRHTLTSDDGTNVGVVHFSPGARTHWHSHPGGQWLYAVSGRGRVRTQGEAGHLLQAGDVVYVRSDELHFHGADADAPMVHVAVNLGGVARWSHPVTDEEYDEGF